ncbi:hypothetical protein [Crystallibacter degradans]|uniref:hypothetical protein n=1 Tax=Crystallibacter degradans TaxID=2726743 RepID=UPI0014740B4C|nr:hypothetical protein [Arthrobacter sp. SF27]NMR29933.1 hypothetical protein [Arthrobacter sp. SF27]
MAKPSNNHRSRYRRKRAIARNIMADNTLDDGVKMAALYVLKLADDDGVIYNDELHALWREMEAEGG